MHGEAGSAKVGVLGDPPQHYMGKWPPGYAGARPIMGGMWCGTGTPACAQYGCTLCIKHRQECLCHYDSGQSTRV